MVSPIVSTPFRRAFDLFWHRLGSPYAFVIPQQVPAGASYSDTLGVWIDGNNQRVTKKPSELDYVEIPAIWGQDALELNLTAGGIPVEGQQVLITHHKHFSLVKSAMRIITGDIEKGKQYTIVDLDSGPEGAGAVFLVATLKVYKKSEIDGGSV